MKNAGMAMLICGVLVLALGQCAAGANYYIQVGGGLTYVWSDLTIYNEYNDADPLNDPPVGGPDDPSDSVTVDSTYTTIQLDSNIQLDKLYVGAWTNNSNPAAKPNFDLNGYDLTVNELRLTNNGLGGVLMDSAFDGSTGDGALTANLLHVGYSGVATLTPNDTVKRVETHYSGKTEETNTVFTSDVGNITEQVSLPYWNKDNAGELFMGADLSISGALTVGGIVAPDSNYGYRSIVHTGGHDLTFGSSNIAGTIDALPGTTIHGDLTLQGTGILRLTQGDGDRTGVTLDADLSNVGLVDLVFDAGDGSAPDWGLRWLGDHLADLAAMETAGTLAWSGAAGTVSIFDGGDGYTYVGYGFVPLAGDANNDGIVDSQDFTILKANFGANGGWSEGDFNDDGLVDSQDFTILKAHFGETAGTVPEPATLSLLALGGLAMLKRRR